MSWRAWTWIGRCLLKARCSRQNERSQERQHSWEIRSTQSSKGTERQEIGSQSLHRTLRSRLWEGNERVATGRTSKGRDFGDGGSKSVSRRQQTYGQETDTSGQGATSRDNAR